MQGTTTSRHDSTQVQCRPRLCSVRSCCPVTGMGLVPQIGRTGPLRLGHHNSCPGETQVSTPGSRTSLQHFPKVDMAHCGSRDWKGWILAWFWWRLLLLITSLLTCGRCLHLSSHPCTSLAAAVGASFTYANRRKRLGPFLLRSPSLSISVSPHHLIKVLHELTELSGLHDINPWEPKIRGCGWKLI